jgi:hypothetical protein
MEIRDHLFDSIGEAGHVADQLVLVSTVHTHVRIGWPNQNRINPAVPSTDIGVETAGAGNADECYKQAYGVTA